VSVKWSELYRWSMVEVEFGFSKDYIIDIVKDDPTCIDIQNRYVWGINLNYEFSFRHRAIVVSKSYKGSKISVVPITEWNPSKSYDLQDESKIFVKQSEYPYLFTKDSIILINEIQTISKKSRVRKIIKSFIPDRLKTEIAEKIKNFYA